MKFLDSEQGFSILSRCIWYDVLYLSTEYFTRNTYCQHYVFLFSILLAYGCEIAHNFYGCIWVWSQIYKIWMWLCKKIWELFFKKNHPGLGSVSDMAAEIKFLTLEICFQILTWPCLFLKWLYLVQWGNNLGNNLPETHLPKLCSHLLRAGIQRWGND